MNPIKERIEIIKRYRKEIFSHLQEYQVCYTAEFIQNQFKMMDKKISDLEAQEKVFVSSNLLLSDEKSFDHCEE